MADSVGYNGNPDDVEDLMSVGAKAVALGTALFRDPSLAKKLRLEFGE